MSEPKVNMKITIERFVIIALLILAAYLGWNAYFRKAEKAIEYKRVNVQKTDSLQHWKDKYDQEHGKRLLVEGDLNTLKTIDGPYIDSLKDVLGIKDKQLQEYAHIQTQTTGNIYVPVEVQEKDGKTTRHFKYKDKWLWLDGSVDSMASIDYGYSDDLGYTVYWKRKWFLAPKQQFIDVFSRNPKTKIVGFTGVRIDNKAYDHFYMDGFIGYDMANAMQTLNAGLRARYFVSPRFSLEATGAYTYDGSKSGKALTLKTAYNLFKL